MTPADQTLFADIELLLLDVDGVLTDGSISYTGSDMESKTFSVKDGLGLKLLADAGIKTGIVTGRTSAALLRRCRELGIVHIYDGVKNKAAVLDDILAATGVASPATVAFAGDDLPDIPLLKKVGLPIAVANAQPEVKSVAAVITLAEGGRGAVREICEALLHARGLWRRAVCRYVEAGD